MIIERNLDLSLEDLVKSAFAVELSVPGVKDATDALMTFFFDRLRVMLRDEEYSAQEVDAVLAKHIVKPADFVRRIEAVKKFMMLPEAQS